MAIPLATNEPAVRLVPVGFSGAEPEAVVRWVRQIRGATNSDPYCRLLGREPVTSTAFFIEGVVTEERWTKYDRGFTVTTLDGSSFKVGGTNTTSSIAAFFTVLEAPARLLPPRVDSWAEISASASQLDRLVGEGDTQSALDLLDRIEYWARADALSRALREPLESLLPSGRLLLEDLLMYRPLMPDEPGPAALWEEITDVLCRAENGDESVHQRACEVVVVLPSRQTLEFLVASLGSTNSSVSRSAALGLRDMEYVIQRLSSDDPLLVKRFVTELDSQLSGAADAETRVYLAEALGYFGIDDDAVLETLTERLSSDDEYHVRWAAAVALGRRSLASEALGALIKCVKVESNARVKRAALLSLGRLLKRIEPDPLAVTLAAVDVSDLELALLELVGDTDDGIATYAAYALGELAHVSQHAVDVLLANLRPSRSYATIAHVVLALSKVLSRQRLSNEQRETLRSAMAEPLLLRDEREHPASSYHEWLTLTAWRILSRLEVSELAARFARRAAVLFRNFPARTSYLDGLAHHQLAEHLLQTAGAHAAIGSLRTSIDCFNSATQAPRVPGDLGDAARVAAVTRGSLATARLSFLEALETLEAAGFRNHGSSPAIRASLSAGREAIDTVLRSRPSRDLGPYRFAAPAGEISDRAHRVLQWMREATYLVEHLEDLREALAERADETDLLRIVGVTRGVVDRLGTLAAECDSPSIDAIQDLLLNDLESCGLTQASVPGIAQEQAAQLVTYTVRTLRSPIPVPDVDHRLLGAGRAKCSVYPENALSGTGAEGDAWVFASAGPVVLRVVVQVELRSDEELLVLRAADGTGMIQESVVQVHEGTEAVEVDLTDRVAQRLDLTLSLTFLSSGYSEEVDLKSVSLVRAESLVRSESTSALLDSLIELRGQQQHLQRQIEELRSAEKTEYVPIIQQRRAELEEVEEDIRAASRALSEEP